MRIQGTRRTRRSVTLTRVCARISYFDLFNEDVHDCLDNRSNVRTLFLPHTPLSSTPICPCPFFCSVLRRAQADADPHAQARIFPAHIPNVRRRLGPNPKPGLCYRRCR
jgi:hypothetical protein